eukprot:12600694-Alexandrium_andersonii.AAC.1
MHACIVRCISGTTGLLAWPAPANYCVCVPRCIRTHACQHSVCFGVVRGSSACAAIHCRQSVVERNALQCGMQRSRRYTPTRGVV